MRPREKIFRFSLTGKPPLLPNENEFYEQGD